MHRGGLVGRAVGEFDRDRAGLADDVQVGGDEAVADDEARAQSRIGLPPPLEADRDDGTLGPLRNLLDRQRRDGRRIGGDAVGRRERQAQCGGDDGVCWLAESVCWPRVANTTRAVALPLTNVMVAGSVAAASVEVSVAVPPWEGTGLPWASSARSVTVTGTPTGTARGSMTANRVTTGAAVTVVVTVPVISPAAPPRTERL
jgi:hypothetical protein